MTLTDIAKYQRRRAVGETGETDLAGRDGVLGDILDARVGRVVARGLGDDAVEAVGEEHADAVGAAQRQDVDVLASCAHAGRHFVCAHFTLCFVQVLTSLGASAPSLHLVHVCCTGIHI